MSETGAPVRIRPNVQLGLGLPTEVMARLDRLRACMGVPRGKVVEAALTGSGLAELERLHADGIQRFTLLAERAGLTWTEYAQDYAMRYSAKTWYPPTVEDLEKEGAAVA